MDEQTVRRIAQEEARNAYMNMSQRDQFKVANTSIHAHTGTDSPRIQAQNITGAVVLPKDFGFTVNAPIGGSFVFPLPSVDLAGPGQSVIGEGATEGTAIVAFNSNTGTCFLWCLVFGNWHGVELDL